MMMTMTMMVLMLMLPGAGRKNLFKIQNGKRKIVSIFITLGAKCAVIHKGSKAEEEGGIEGGSNWQHIHIDAVLN